MRQYFRLPYARIVLPVEAVTEERIQKMQDDVIFRFEMGTLTAKVRCEIDHHTARRMRSLIDERMFEVRPSMLILDFSEVRFMDSSGIGLILGRCDSAADIGITVRLVGLSNALMRLVRMSGIERVRNLSVSPKWAEERPRQRDAEWMQ